MKYRNKNAEQDDLIFYEEILMKEPEEVQRKFFEDHPDFLQEYPLNPIKDGRIELLKDNTYRGIMRKIKRRIQDNS